MGPLADAGVFANVTTDPMRVSTAAAMWAYIDAKGKPGCIYFTDSTYAIAIAKAKKMQEVIEKLGGATVEWVDTPIAETSQRMPQLTTSLLQKHGDKWTEPGNIVTSGPFRLATWQHKVQLTMKKSDSWWDAAKVKLNTVDVIRGIGRR